jgi:hypothetical protein
MDLQTSAALSRETIRIIEVLPYEAAIVSAKDHCATIADGCLLIFRGALAGTDLVALRRALLQWAGTFEPFPCDQSASRPGLNFHRLDDGSAPTTMPHIFHQFGFSNLAGLPRDLKSVLTSISTMLLELQNALAGTSFTLDGQGFRTKIMRHPRCGGYLVPHRHPYLPQRVSVFLNLSQPGIDYAQGGVSFKPHDAWIGTFEEFRLGDVLAWRYDMLHQVEPVDPGRPQKWDGDDGYWIYALEMDHIHALSNAVHLTT